MSELYLIAHKVRGEPAFDVAERIECNSCPDHPEHSCNDSIWCKSGHEGTCEMCDGEGFWWIIPTSGHRAYPFRYWPWDELACDSHLTHGDSTNYVEINAGPIPPGLPDHYPHSAEPAKPSLLSLIPKPVEAPIRRRV